MKVNSYTNKSIAFNGIYNSKFLKHGLEFAADNGALFAATTSLVLSTVVRPVAILLTPKTDKENKKTACAKSLSSSLIGYGIMLGVSKPVSNAIKKIDNAPKEYLTEKTIQVLQNGNKSLTAAKGYVFATQLFKLGVGALIAAPKAILTALMLPVFLNNKHQELKSTQPTFTGRGLDGLIAKIMNNGKVQKFVDKFKDSNFPMHLVALTDIATTATFTKQIKDSKKVEATQKKPLIYNSIISTGLSIIMGYTADKLLDKPTEKFVDKFKKANKNSPKLDKYLEGIKIAKPILIMGAIYYTFIPVISTFVADRINKLSGNKNQNNVRDTI